MSSFQTEKENCEKEYEQKIEDVRCKHQKAYEEKIKQFVEYEKLKLEIKIKKEIKQLEKEQKQIIKKLKMDNIEKRNDDKQELKEFQKTAKIAEEVVEKFLDDNFEVTTNRKNILKCKDIYSIFKTNEIFTKLTKQEKRNSNYKYFMSVIENNSKYSVYYKLNKDKTNIMTHLIKK